MFLERSDLIAKQCGCTIYFWWISLFIF